MGFPSVGIQSHYLQTGLLKSMREWGKEVVAELSAGAQMYVSSLCWTMGQETGVEIQRGGGWPELGCTLTGKAASGKQLSGRGFDRSLHGRTHFRWCSPDR